MAKIPFTLEAWLKDKSQKVETRDGRSARLICTDAKADDGACVIALITDDGGEEAYQFFPDGSVKAPNKTNCENCDIFKDKKPISMIDVPLCYSYSLNNHKIVEYCRSKRVIWKRAK